MKTSTIVRLAAVCSAAFITFALFESVATLARPDNTHVAGTLAVAKVQARDSRSGRR
jgi:hypothetical protein